MKITLKFEQLKAQLKKIQEGLEAAVDAGLKEAAERGAEVARTQRAYTSRSSSGLISKTVAYRQNALNHGIIANTNYASWVEFGNGPAGSRIYPTKSSALHFFIDGKEIFAKSVKASEPKPFMANALAFEQQNASDIVGQSITNFFESIK